jgi:phosphatidylserine decarboxylase
MGFLGRQRWPAFMLQPFLRWYVDRYGAKPEESTKPLEAYGSFLEFFTRPLQDGARSQPEDSQTISSPCDGRVSSCGRIEAGQLLQIKNVWYSVADLLDCPAAAADLDGGSYVTIYLAPGDYHRFHWPFDGTVHEVRHIPGDLWPVNKAAVGGVRGLFAVNERVAVMGKMANGAPFAYVPVGALNVGSIKLGFHDIQTNRLLKKATPLADNLRVEGRRGDEFGHFEFGSTVVLLIGKRGGRLTRWPPRTSFKMGDPIGHLA